MVTEQVNAPLGADGNTPLPKLFVKFPRLGVPIVDLAVSMCKSIDEDDQFMHDAKKNTTDVWVEIRTEVGPNAANGWTNTSDAAVAKSKSSCAWLQDRMRSLKETNQTRDTDMALVTLRRHWHATLSLVCDLWMQGWMHSMETLRNFDSSLTVNSREACDIVCTIVSSPPAGMMVDLFQHASRCYSASDAVVASL